MPALARLRRSWLEERAGHPRRCARLRGGVRRVVARRAAAAHVLAGRVGTERSGFTAIGSINVVEIVHMPRPAPAPGRIGHIGNAFVLASFADRGVPAALLTAVVEHARERRYRSLLLAPHRGQLTAFYRARGLRARAASRCLATTPHRLSGDGSRAARGGRQPRSADRRARAAAVRQARAAALPRPTATSPAASSAPSAGPGSRWRTRTASARTRRLSWVGAAPTGAASEAEYVEIGLTEAVEPGAVAARWTPPSPTAWTPRRGPAGRRRAGRPHRREPVVIELPGVAPADARCGARGPARARSVVVERVTPSGRADRRRAPALVDRAGAAPPSRDRCLCDTDGGRAAHDTRCSTRRRVGCTRRCRGSTAPGPTAGDPDGAGAARR